MDFRVLCLALGRVLVLGIGAYAMSNGVHASPVEVRTCGSHELGDERENGVVRRSPIEGPAFVLGTAVEGHVRRVDQLRHDRFGITVDTLEILAIRP